MNTESNLERANMEIHIYRIVSRERGVFSFAIIELEKDDLPYYIVLY